MSRSSPSDFPPDLLNDYCGRQLLGTCVAFIILGLTFVGLRFYTRLFTMAESGWDSYLIVPALTANLALQVEGILLVTDGGVGYHIEHWKVYNPLVIFSWAKVLFAVELTYLLSVALGKLTILAIYARIFAPKRMLCTTYALAAIVTASWFGSTIANILQSRPVGCQWDPTASKCQSFNILAYFRYLSLPSIITDFVMLVLPMPMIWRLNLPRSQKLGLTGVFLTGSIGIIASCVRFAIFFQSDALQDPTWKSSLLNVWTITEPATYLIAACLPPLRPLFLSAMHRLHLAYAATSQTRPADHTWGGYGGYRIRGKVGGLHLMERGPKNGERSNMQARETVEGRFQRLPGEGTSPNPKNGIEVRRDFNVVFEDGDLCQVATSGVNIEHTSQ